MRGLSLPVPSPFPPSPIPGFRSFQDASPCEVRADVPKNTLQTRLSLPPPHFPGSETHPSTLCNAPKYCVRHHVLLSRPDAHTFVRQSPLLNDEASLHHPTGEAAGFLPDVEPPLPPGLSRLQGHPTALGLGCPLSIYPSASLRGLCWGQSCAFGKASVS